VSTGWGLMSFALGGVLLIFMLYLIVSSAQSPYLSRGGLINGLAFGFAAFLLLGLGLFLIVRSAVANVKS